MTLVSIEDSAYKMHARNYCQTTVVSFSVLQKSDFFFVVLRPIAGQDLLIHEVSRSHTQRRTTSLDK